MNEVVLILFAVAAAASAVWFLPRRNPAKRPPGSAPHERWIAVERDEAPVVMSVQAGQQVKLRLTRPEGTEGREIRCEPLGLARHLPAGTTTTVDLHPTGAGVWPLTIDGRAVAILAVRESETNGGGVASAVPSETGQTAKAGA